MIINIRLAMRDLKCDSYLIVPYSSLESPMESFKGDDLEIGSCLSSPAASVLSDFSEMVYAQDISKHRGLKIF